jgi:hypothetical protein
MRRALWFVALTFGLFLIARAIVELFVVDMGSPASYRNDWGGPSLFGVLLVHVGPGVIAAVVIAIMMLRRRSARPARGH